jgi:hypothetical protein
MEPSVLYQHFHADHLQAPAVGERPTIVAPGHGTLFIVVDEFAQDACRRLAGEETEVNSTLGVPLSCEDAAFACPQWYQVSWAGEITGKGGGRRECTRC